MLVRLLRYRGSIDASADDLWEYELAHEPDPSALSLYEVESTDELPRLHAEQAAHIRVTTGKGAPPDARYCVDVGDCVDEVVDEPDEGLFSFRSERHRECVPAYDRSRQQQFAECMYEAIQRGLSMKTDRAAIRTYVKERTAASDAEWGAFFEQVESKKWSKLNDAPEPADA